MKLRIIKFYVNHYLALVNIIIKKYCTKIIDILWSRYIIHRIVKKNVVNEST